MSTPRKTIADAIQADHAASRWVVHDYPMVPAQVNAKRPVVSVWRSDLEPSSNRTMLDHKITIQGYAPGTGAKAEDELDEVIDGILLSLERISGFVVTKATRQTFNETIAGITVEGTVISKNVYREAVLTERSTNGTATA